MSFEQKKQRAIAILDSKKIRPRHYAPPLLRGLWKMGSEIPPLPFASFWQITAMMGIVFGPLFGLVMWFFAWQRMGVSPGRAIMVSLVSGLLFGVIMAAFYGWRKKANQLPDWKDL